MWPLIKILPTKTHVPFVSLARVFATLSILAVIATGVGVFYPGVNLGDVLVQRFGADNDAVVRFQTPTAAAAGAVADNVKGVITKALGQVTFSRMDVVGPEVSGELEGKGLLALFTAVGLMLIYIWFRFELQFGLGAVVALFHDLILSFGLILLLRLEFSLNLIAALLTIIGYSMNDTVVVFDRLRENRRKYKRMPLRELIDLSVNETLTRTVITGLTALLALSGLAIFGGESLRPLSIVLLFGIVIGTYSSIYVASPIILLWGARRDDEPAKPIGPQPASIVSRP